MLILPDKSGQGISPAYVHCSGPCCVDGGVSNLCFSVWTRDIVCSCSDLSYGRMRSHVRSSMSPYRQCFHILSCHGVGRVEPALEFAVDTFGQFRVRRSPSGDACERIRTAVVRTHSMCRLILPWISLHVRLQFVMVPLAAYVSSKQGPHRLVVRTSRRGLDNPGSTPGAVICTVLMRVYRCMFHTKLHTESGVKR